MGFAGTEFPPTRRLRYPLDNPFAGVKVRGTRRSTVLDTSHAFTDGEWILVRAVADGLESRPGAITAVAGNSALQVIGIHPNDLPHYTAVIGHSKSSGHGYRS